MAPATKKGATRRPRQQALIGDSRIEQLDQLARDYAEVRDRRMALTRQESEMKEELKTAMHKHRKETYICDGITIKLVRGEEEVKVKIKAVDVEIDDEE